MQILHVWLCSVQPQHRPRFLRHSSSVRSAGSHDVGQSVRNGAGFIVALNAGYVFRWQLRSAGALSPDLATRASCCPLPPPPGR